MAILTRKRLQALLRPTPGPCISLYIPTHRRRPESDQDPIRFRNALREAERLLSDRHSPAAIRALLDPVAALATSEFWRWQSHGLAVLRSPDVLEEFRLPGEVPELVVVADSFHVRPLVRVLNANRPFFVLAISRNSAELFEGSPDALDPVVVPGMPAGLEDFASGRGPSRYVNAHATSRGGQTRRGHGTGGSESSGMEDLVPYFRAIDRAVVRLLRQVEGLVILAGVEQYLPLYQKVTRLRRLADSVVPGSPDSMGLAQLHAGALAIAQGAAEATAEQALQKFERAAGRGRACDRLDDIVRAAKRGSVRRLLVARGVHVWGTLDPTTGQVVRTETQQGSRDDDVLDDVAEAVLAHGGEVHSLPAERMPRAAEAVAELR